MSLTGFGPKCIEHTYLKADASPANIEKLCAEAIEYKFGAVCVPPYYVRYAATQLKETTIKIVTVVGFPFGYATTPAKVEEIKRALDDGADEIDAVINLNALRAANWTYVKNDITSMTAATHLKGKIFKIIIETGLLNPDELQKICEICTDAGVNFVKTSTGVLGQGATPDIIQQLRKHLPQSIEIKASGGIQTAQQAHALFQAGATRIGSSSSPNLL